jgi:aminoglycoside phosphotransferase (APT) family kinase protein
MFGQLNAFLLENGPDWQLPGGGQWHFWIYNNWHPHCANLDVMWFHDNDRFPLVVTKLDREQKALAREFENLACVHSRVPGCVPRPFNFLKLGDFWALWMEGLPGFPSDMVHSTKMRHSIVKALVSIHTAVHGRIQRTGDERYRQMVCDPLHVLAQFGDSAAVRTACARLSQKIDKGWVDSLPALPQHGDLYSGNILWFRDQPQLLDWESFGEIDLPFYDLLILLVSLLIPDGTAPAPDSVRQAPSLIKLYSAGIGLAVPDLELLFPLALANWFHLKRTNGGRKSTERVYRLIARLFERSDIWRSTFTAVS